MGKHTGKRKIGDYEVGYGKPPKGTRFPPGKSGNPRGREPGSRGLKTDLEAALKERHTIQVGGQRRKGTTQMLTMLTMSLRAANGDLRAQKLLTDLILGILGPEDRGKAKEQLSAHDQALLDGLLGEVAQEEEEEEGDTGPNDDTGPKNPPDSGDDDGEEGQ